MKTRNFLFAIVMTMLLVGFTTSCSSDDDNNPTTRVVSITYEATTSQPQYVGLTLSYKTGEMTSAGEDVSKEVTVANPSNGWSANTSMDLYKVLPFIMGNVYLTQAGIDNGIKAQDVTITLKIKQDGVVVAESTQKYGTQTFLTGITHN